jgi:hypothetical protein
LRERIVHLDERRQIADPMVVADDADDQRTRFTRRTRTQQARGRR